MSDSLPPPLPSDDQPEYAESLQLRDTIQQLLALYDRAITRMLALRTQSYSLLGQLLAVYSIMVVGLIGFVTIGIRPITLTLVIFGLVTVMYVVAFALLLVTIQLSSFRDFKWNRERMAQLLGYGEAALLTHYMRRLIDMINDNEAAHEKKVKKHEKAFKLYIAASLIMMIYVAARTAYLLAFKGGLAV